MNPERLGCAGSRYPVNGRKRSLRDVAAELEARGHVNERGKRYAATAISRMLASGRAKAARIVPAALLAKAITHQRRRLFAALFRLGFKCKLPRTSWLCRGGV
jgi:hypothetical protein